MKMNVRSKKISAVSTSHIPNCNYVSQYINRAYSIFDYLVQAINPAKRPGLLVSKLFKQTSLRLFNRVPRRVRCTSALGSLPTARHLRCVYASAPLAQMLRPAHAPARRIAPPCHQDGQAREAPGLRAAFRRKGRTGLKAKTRLNDVGRLPRRVETATRPCVFTCRVDTHHAVLLCCIY